MVAINDNGTIKTFSSIPAKWGKQHNYPAMDASVHYVDGFREVVEPQIDYATQKRGKIYFDATNDVFTYEAIAKSPEELEAGKIQKQQIEKEKIKQEKLEKLAEQNLTPEERLKWYDEWKTGVAYKIGERATYKLKTFENTVEGNINAPDKGGWIEVK